MEKYQVDSLSEDKRRILLRHIAVGPLKPVSYLPIQTVENTIEITLAAYLSLIENSGHQGIVLNSTECCIKSGAVYAYSCRDLAGVLEANAAVLRRYGWPVSCVEFIRRMATEWVEEGDPVLLVIRKVFGEA